MILSITHTVPGREIASILGIARGSTVRARHVVRDIIAGIIYLILRRMRVKKKENFERRDS